MQMFFEKTAQYEGNFAKEAEGTISGSLGSMQAAFSDLMGNLALGRDITPSLMNLSETVLSFLKNNISPAVINIAKSLPKALPDLVKSLANILVESAPVIIEGTGEMIRGLVKAFPSIWSSVFSAMVNIGSMLVEGLWNGTEFRLVAADRLNFRPFTVIS